MAVAVFFCLFVCLFVFYYYFYYLFTSLLTPRVIQNHIARVFIYKSRFKLWKKKRIGFVSFFNISGCPIYYRVFVLIWHGLSPWLFHEYHWFFALYSCSFLLKFSSNSYCITTFTRKHKITHAVNATMHCFFSTFKRN